MNTAERQTQLILEPIVDQLDDLLQTYHTELANRTLRDIAEAGLRLYRVVERLAEHAEDSETHQ